MCTARVRPESNTLSGQRITYPAVNSSTAVSASARPALSTIQPDSGEVRSFYEDYRKVRWQKKGPTEAQGFWPIVVGTGLTFNDVQTTGKLSDVAREVLDIMWTVQREDGGWKMIVHHADNIPVWTTIVDGK